MTIPLNDGDLLEGDATTAAKVTYVIGGLDGDSPKRLASGQLPNAKGTLYTAVGVDTITSIKIKNTNTSAEAVNLYVQDGTASRLILGIAALPAGYHVLFDGNKLSVYDENGVLRIETTAIAHAASHQNAGGDEISVAGLSGLLADDQHVLDAEVQAIKIDDLTAGDDNTDLDVNTTRHGLTPKAVAPAAGLVNVYGIANTETAITNKPLFDAISPSTQAIGDAAAVGTATVATRRDHKHAMPSQATMDAASVAAVEAAGLALAAGKAIKYATPTGNQTASGIIKTKTAGAALVFGNACYTGTDGKMEKALADDAAITIPATHLCLGTIAENAEGLFLEQGEAYNNSWAFDIGKSIYLSVATAGLITKTMPTKVTGNQVQVLGTCVEAVTKVFWNPSPVVMEYA